jgi:hypothetical protein
VTEKGRFEPFAGNATVGRSWHIPKLLPATSSACSRKTEIPTHHLRRFQTEAERLRADDPRPSLEARYASRDAWSARLAEAVDRLVAERLLLAEDGDRLATAARESWDVYQEL